MFTQSRQGRRIFKARKFRTDLDTIHAHLARLLADKGLPPYGFGAAGHRADFSWYCTGILNLEPADTLRLLHHRSEPLLEQIRRERRESRSGTGVDEPLASLMSADPAELAALRAMQPLRHASRILRRTAEMVEEDRMAKRDVALRRKELQQGEEKEPRLAKARERLTQREHDFQVYREGALAQPDAPGSSRALGVRQYSEVRASDMRRAMSEELALMSAGMGDVAARHAQYFGKVPQMSLPSTTLVSEEETFAVAQKRRMTPTVMSGTAAAGMGGGGVARPPVAAAGAVAKKPTEGMIEERGRSKTPPMQPK